MSAERTERVQRRGEEFSTRKGERRNARHRPKALLLRNGIIYSGKSCSGDAHLRWTARLKMERATQQIGFQEYLHSISKSTWRIEWPEQAMRDALPDCWLMPLVQALQAVRCMGCSLTSQPLVSAAGASRS